jgi:hypothetical protein
MSTPTESLAIIFGLGAATWAAFKNLGDAAKQLNDMRNVILVGKIGSDDLTREHKKLILENDWIPGEIAAVSMSIAYGIIILLIPLAQKAAITDSLWWACILFSIFPFFAGIAFLTTGFKEYRIMRENIGPADKGDRDSNE